MVPIYPLGLLALNTLYNFEEIPYFWKSLSDISHLDFSFHLKNLQIISQDPITKLLGSNGQEKIELKDAFGR